MTKIVSYGKFRQTYDERVRAFYHDLMKAETTLEKKKLFIAFYQYLKNLSFTLGAFSEATFNFYDTIGKDTESLEEEFLDEKITNVLPNFDYISYKRVLGYHDDEFILHSLVGQTRLYLAKKLHLTTGRQFQNANLTNLCLKASLYLKKLCNQKHIKINIIKINPGFREEDNLYDGNGFHYFSVIQLHDKKYLIDTTYSQFFFLKENILSRIGVVGLSGCNPGAFMYLNKERKKVADKILQDGFILLTKDTLKSYLDGFTISYRNASFYELTNDFSLETPYTHREYQQFLEGKCSQAFYEGIENLGYQCTPTKLNIGDKL